MIQLLIFPYMRSSKPTRKNRNMPRCLRPPGGNGSVCENESEVLHLFFPNDFFIFPNCIIELDNEFDHLAIAHMVCCFHFFGEAWIIFNMSSIGLLRLPNSQRNRNHELSTFKGSAIR